VVAVALGMLVVALIGVRSPYHQTREFRAVVACDKARHDCLARERGSIAGRSTYETTDTDANNNTTTTTHYQVTWRRADGTSRQTWEVSPGFYRRVSPGQPATLRVWRGQVVGVEVEGGAQWRLPSSGLRLGYWLVLAFLGIGVVLWGLFGWWDGFFLLVFRSVAWLCIGVMPTYLTTHALAYGLDPGGISGWAIVTGVPFTGMAGWILLTTLDHRRG